MMVRQMDDYSCKFSTSPQWWIYREIIKQQTTQKIVKIVEFTKDDRYMANQHRKLSIIIRKIKFRPQWDTLTLHLE